MARSNWLRSENKNRSTTRNCVAQLIDNEANLWFHDQTGPKIDSEITNGKIDTNIEEFLIWLIYLSPASDTWLAVSSIDGVELENMKI